MEPIPISPINSFKKRLSQIYNQINQEMYGLGVREQKIEILHDKIVIFGQHKRVPALSVLGGKYQELTLSVDAALVTEYKARLKQQLEKILDVKVVTILKDYDPVTEFACTVIYLEKPIQ